jgi:hypothetical protein
VFGLEPVGFPTTKLLGAPADNRSRDLITAFEDKNIKAVIASLGGDDQVTKHDPMCEFFSGDEVGEMQPGTTQPNVREDRHGMHEPFAQQPIAQMPQIVSPDPLDGSTLDELAEDGVDAVAPAGENTAQPRPRILFSAVERGQELDATLGELLTEAWRPEVAIANEQTDGASGKVFGGEFLPIARGELDLADDTGPADARMQAEAVEGQMREMIMAIGGLPSEAPAARGACELAYWEGKAVNDGELRIMGDLGADPLPEPIFHYLQVRCLAHEGRPVDTGERREEVSVVAPEVGEEGTILLHAEVLPDNFHRQHFAVG